MWAIYTIVVHAASPHFPLSAANLLHQFYLYVKEFKKIIKKKTVLVNT